MNGLDHDLIRGVLDRSATKLLVALLLSDRPDAHEREEIERTLIALDDVRCVVALQAAGESPAAEAIIRASALRVITSMLGARVLPIREWWATDDPVLRFAAATVLGSREFGDLVAPVLDDPNHPLLARVLASIDIGFEEPVWQSRRIRSLSDERPNVRAAAAASLLWDEPVAAEMALIDGARDLDVDVAVEAVATLMYYPTVAVLDALVAVQVSPNETLAAAARVSLEQVISDFRDAVAIAPKVAMMQRWVRAVDAHGGVLHETPSPASPESPQLLRGLEGPRSSVAWDAELRAEIDDLDGEWNLKYVNIRMLDPLSIPRSERGTVVEFLACHPDPEVRSAVAQHLPFINGAAALVAMLDDPMITVSKSAMYALHDIADGHPLVPVIRERAWEAVVDGSRTGIRASEALRTFVRHGESLGSAFVQERLVSLLDDGRESVRLAALEQLVSLQAVDVIAQQLTRLAEPPEVTWAVHGTLLEAAARFSLPVDPVVLARLGRVDHAWLAAAVAKLLPDA